MPRRSSPRQSAGYALLLVLIALAFASALGAAMILSRGPAAAVANNVRHSGDARALAEAALEIAADMAMDETSFRTAYSNDVWSADQPFESGSFRVKFADPDDGDLADDNAEMVRITVIAEVEGRTHEVSALFTPPQPRARYEVGKFTAGPTPTAVSFRSAYEKPVVVATVDATNNAPDRPVVVRVQNVTSTGFEAYLQNPGDLSTPVADEVYFLVMEEGAHDFDGIVCEAWTMTAPAADYKGSTEGNAASYLQDYTTPIVIGQVMTTNDSRWSTFWTRGNARGAPPNASTLRVGMKVSEDTDRVRVPETLGVIVFEAGNYDVGGVQVQAFKTGNVVGGIRTQGDRVYKPDYPVTFDSPPKFAVATQAGENGGDMSWVVFPDDDPLHADHHIHLAVDEDQIRDTERNHVNEEIFIVAFEGNPTSSTGAGLNVVMLVDDASRLDQEDQDRISLLQRFGMNVELLDAQWNNEYRVNKMLAADVVYISSLANDGDFLHLIDDLAVPFVNEHVDLVDDLGIAASGSGIGNDRYIDIVDNGHPITAGFDVQEHFRILDNESYLTEMSFVVASGAQVLGDRDGSGTNVPTFAALDRDAERTSGGPSPSRRVQLPWGESNFDPDELNANGQELLRQSLIWAAGGQITPSDWEVPPRLVWEEPTE